MGERVDIVSLGNNSTPRLVLPSARVWQPDRVRAAQPVLGRADRILHRRIARAHLSEHSFGGDAAVHHLDAPGLAVLRLDLEAARRGLVAG
jgi:hypothetical protein